ncbi:hypothetical protein BSU01_22575 [Erwinia billingiae]|uniref:hypothetical protein n=1 Tax=Erwinia billingiae TaxID=182337 RepID=UPI001EB4FDCB|nr:hypothetical protein [Erwinia billingiae]MBN7124476.1 hypothetical protein [Erwinia billingiae]
MLYNYPEYPYLGFMRGIRYQQVITLSCGNDVPEAARRKGRVEFNDFAWSLPIRYSGLPVRRRLIRMMLTLQKYGKAGENLNGFGRDAFTPTADYARSVIDAAMLRGELCCRPSNEMAYTYLTQTEELLKLMAGVPQDKALLRKEVRRRTADFLQRYAAGTEV